MKHTIRVTFILLAMFFITQLIGIFVVSQYAPVITQSTDEQGNLINETSHNLPFGLDPPEEVQPRNALVSIIIAIIFAAFLMLIFMKYKFELILRVWFFLVFTLALSITINSVLIGKTYGIIISLIVALPLTFLKVFRRNMTIHNLTELGIYPGIAAIFVPLFNIWAVVVLLIAISIYDIYAVWHAGFMQKMAHYQINNVKTFAGFFIPYIGKKEKELMKKARSSKSKNKKEKRIKVNVAILGGGDVLFPIVLAGVVFFQLGLVQAILISIGATIALGTLFYYSQKGKFYPAMPFITAGCFLALAVAYLI